MLKNENHYEKKILILKKKSSKIKVINVLFKFSSFNFKEVFFFFFEYNKVEVKIFLNYFYIGESFFLKSP